MVRLHCGNAEGFELGTVAVLLEPLFFDDLRRRLARCEHFRKNLLADLLGDFAAVDYLGEIREILGRDFRLRKPELVLYAHFRRGLFKRIFLLELRGGLGGARLTLGDKLAAQVVYDEVCDCLRVLGIDRNRFFEIFADFGDMAHHGSRRIRQPEFRHIAALAVERHFGQLRANRFEILPRNLHGHQVGIGEIAVVVGVLLCTHRLGDF